MVTPEAGVLLGGLWPQFLDDQGQPFLLQVPFTHLL